MDIKDTQKLSPSDENLEIIKKQFENSMPLETFTNLYAHYIKMATDLSYHTLVVDSFETVKNQYSMKNQKSYEDFILPLVFDAAIKIGAYEKAKTYILLMRESLPVMKQYVAILSEVTLRKATQKSYIELLNQLESDVLPTPDTILVLKELYDYYKAHKQYSVALVYLDKLNKYDVVDPYRYDRYELLYLIGHFPLLEEKALDDLKKDPLDALIALYVIKAYIKQEKYPKAVNLEVEYEPYIDLLDDAFRLDAYETLIGLYKQIKNRPSMEAYSEKLRRLNKALTKKKKEAVDHQVPKETMRDIKPEVEVTLETKEIENIKVIPIKQEIQVKKQFEYTERLIEWFSYSHQIDEKGLLRDYLRTLMIKVNQTLKASDMILYTKQGDVNFYHYKVERLYDKKIIKEFIRYTLVERILATTEAFYGSYDDFKDYINVLNQATYDDSVGYVYGFPVGDFGVLLVYYKDLVQDPGIYYDLIKGLAAIIEAKWIDEKVISRFKKEERFLRNVLNHPAIPIREQTSLKANYNESSMALLKVERHLDFESYLNEIDIKYVRNYQDKMTKLLSRSRQSDTFFYQFKDKFILEKMYSVEHMGDIHVISLFIDQTSNQEHIENLSSEAAVDFETNLATKYQLSKDLDDILKVKATFLLMEMDQTFKYVYGSTVVNHFFVEFSEVAKNYFKDANYYRFDFNQILIVLPYNDIRSVTKELKAFYSLLETYESNILKFEKMRIFTGILKYPTQTVEKQADKLFKYLDIALENAKRSKEEPFMFFKYSDYENEIFEQSVIDQLNYALEHKQFELKFNQIIDIKKNVIWQYESELYMPHIQVDSKYLQVIAQKRKRLIEFEYAHIEKVCMFLNDLEKETKRIIKMTIPISKETFLNQKFNYNLLSMLKKYRIEPEFIHLKTDVDLKSHHYSLQIAELLNAGISLDTTSVDMVINYDFNFLHLDQKMDNERWKTYIIETKKMLDQIGVGLVIRQVKTKETRDQLAKLGIQYIQGKIYQQLLSTELMTKIKESI